ncbi:hypothetical protein IWZ01DRAFT_561986 [Phyllosticta capitalensis]
MNNCRQRGHNSRDCPEPPSAENVECRKCQQKEQFQKDYLYHLLYLHDDSAYSNHDDSNEEFHDFSSDTTAVGHFSKDCPNAPKPVRRNCGEEDHMSKECETETARTLGFFALRATQLWRERHQDGRGDEEDVEPPPHPLSLRCNDGSFWLEILERHDPPGQPASEP